MSRLAVWTRAACPHCSCSRLACPWGEELMDGWPLICGACGALNVFEVEEPERGTASRWRVRHTTADESKRLRQDDQVKAWLAEYDRLILHQAGERLSPGRPTLLSASMRRAPGARRDGPPAPGEGASG